MNTLQNLCLDIIVINFSRYHKHYCTSKDSRLRLNFEFLKKKFSFPIMKTLYENHQLKPEYLNFLVNHYLKVLDTRWLEEWSWESISQKLAEIGPNIEDVFFSDRRYKKLLCYLPNVKHVQFPSLCTDKFLVYLSKFCSCIEVLEMRDSHDVSDEGVKYVLQNMLNLKKIDYWTLYDVLYSMHKSNINAFERIKPYNLTHLNLKNIDRTEFYDDIITVCVSVCPHLKFLTCTIYEKHHLDLWSQLQELEELDLCSWSESHLELNEFLTLIGKTLTSLRIWDFGVSVSVLAVNCPRLNLLNMNQVNLQYNVGDSVPMLQDLCDITFESFIFTELISQGINCLLASVPNLNILKIESCKLVSSDIKTSILRCCEQCKKLFYIHFDDTDVQFSLLRDILVSCSTLEDLILFECDITHDHEAMSQLKMIAVSLPNKPQVLGWNQFSDFDDLQ